MVCWVAIQGFLEKIFCGFWILQKNWRLIVFYSENVLGWTFYHFRLKFLNNQHWIPSLQVCISPLFNLMLESFRSFSKYLCFHILGLGHIFCWRYIIGNPDCDAKAIWWGVNETSPMAIPCWPCVYVCVCVCVRLFVFLFDSVFMMRSHRSLGRPLMTMPSITLMETLQGVQGHNRTKKHQSPRKPQTISKPTRTNGNHEGNHKSSQTKTNQSRKKPKSSHMGTDEEGVLSAS